MQIQPTDHRILVQFHFPEEVDILLPDTVSKFSTNLEEKRTRVEVLKVGQNVTVCKPGDFLLIDDPRNMIPITKEPATALIHDSIVIAIVLDDAQYVR